MKRSLKGTLIGGAVALSVALGALTTPSYAAIKPFVIKYEAKGKITGSLQDLQVVDDVTVTLQGGVELSGLAKAVLGKRTLHNTRSKKVTAWLTNMRVSGNTLIVTGGGRYEKRARLPFGGWTRLFSQSGSVEIHLQLSAVNGKPVVRVTRSKVGLNGILGDVVKLFNLDRSIERRIVPLVQKAIDQQIRQNMPTSAGAVRNISVNNIGFVGGKGGEIGVQVDASAKIKLG